jgi:hypothetical protein
MIAASHLLPLLVPLLGLTAVWFTPEGRRNKIRQRIKADMEIYSSLPSGKSKDDLASYIDAEIRNLINPPPFAMSKVRIALMGTIGVSFLWLSFSSPPLPYWIRAMASVLGYYALGSVFFRWIQSQDHSR